MSERRPRHDGLPPGVESILDALKYCRTDLSDPNLRLTYNGEEIDTEKLRALLDSRPYEVINGPRTYQGYIQARITRGTPSMPDAGPLQRLVDSGMLGPTGSTGSQTSAPREPFHIIVPDASWIGDDGTRILSEEDDDG